VIPRPIAGLLILPGWDDEGRHQFEALKAMLERAKWTCQRSSLPDSNWPVEQRAHTTRADALRQALDDYRALEIQLSGGPVALLGFGFGVYISA
jgi:esterase/lipase